MNVHTACSEELDPFIQRGRRLFQIADSLSSTGPQGRSSSSTYAASHRTYKYIPVDIYTGQCIHRNTDVCHIHFVVSVLRSSPATKKRVPELASLHFEAEWSILVSSSEMGV